MRKAIVVFMAFTMLFTLFGCAGNNRESITDLSVTMYGEKVNSSKEIKLEAGHTLGEGSYYVSVTTKKGAGISPEKLIFASDNPEVAEIDFSNGSYPKYNFTVTGISEGETFVYVSSLDGSVVSPKIKVVVFSRHIRYKCTFNDQGYPLREEHYKQDGTVEDYTEYSYTNENRIEKVFYKSQRGSTERVYTYDNEGRLISDVQYRDGKEETREETKYENDKIISSVTYEGSVQVGYCNYYYNSYGNIKKIVSRYADDRENMVSTYTYTSKQQLLKICDGYESDPEYFGHLDFLYENGKLMRIIGNDPGGEVDYTFHYDEKGNFIEVTFPMVEYDKANGEMYIETYSSDHYPDYNSAQPRDNTDVFMSIFENSYNIDVRKGHYADKEYYDNGNIKEIRLYYY